MESGSIGFELSFGFAQDEISTSLRRRIDSTAMLAESDVYWDEIVSISDCGEEEVFDATVPGMHNFVANDFVVHNSIEQDADVVAFIFREKLYYPTLEAWQRAHPNKPYPDKIAEILVAKHRHGPTKEFSLYFAEEQAKFADLEEPPEERRRKA